MSYASPRSARLTLGCLAAAAVSLAAAAAHAQTSAKLLLKPWEADRMIESRADVSMFARGQTEPGGLKFGLVTVDAEGRLRLPNAPRSLVLGYDLNLMHITSDDPALPRQLTQFSVGPGLHVGDLGDWSFDASAAVGFAGNNRFDEEDSYFAKANFVARWKLDDKSSLILTLNYDGNRSVFPDIPLPTVAYQRKSSEQLSYMVGLPYTAVLWRPVEGLSVDVAYIAPVTFKAEVAYEFAKSAWVFGGYHDRFDAFTLSGAPKHQRLFFEERVVEAGLRWRPAAGAELTLSGGWSFDRSFSTGWDARDTTTLRDLSGEPFVRFGLSLSF